MDYVEDKSNQEQSPKKLRCLFSGISFATLSLRNKTMMTLDFTKYLLGKLRVSYTFFFLPPIKY